MYRRLFVSGALTIWLFLGHGLLPIIKGNLISNFQEFASLNPTDTNTGVSANTFPPDAFPPDNAFPANNDFPPMDVNLRKQWPVTSDRNAPNQNPSGLNQGLPKRNTLSSNAIDNTIGSLSPITTENSGGSIFPSVTHDQFVIPIGIPIASNAGTSLGTVNKPKPTVDSKVNFFLPWIPKGSSFVNLKDGSTHVFQPTDNWIHGETEGQANFGVNLSPAIPIAPIVSKPSFLISGPVPVNSMSLNPKPITPILLPKPIGSVDHVPLATGTNFNPRNPVANTGMNIKPIQLPKHISPVDQLPIVTGTNFKPDKRVAKIGLNFQPINTGALAKPLTPVHLPRPVVVEVTDSTISVSPACEILGQMSLNSMGRDKEEYARLRKHCTQERKEARQASTEQKQIPKAAKQKEKLINQAIRQEQKAFKQDERHNNIAAKQEQNAVIQGQKTANKDEKASLKAIKQEQNSVIPIGVVDSGIKKEERQNAIAASQGQNAVKEEQRAAKKEETSALKAIKQEQKGAVSVGAVNYDNSGALVAHMTLPDKTIFIGKERRGNPRRNRRAPVCKGQARELGLCTPDAVAPLSPACELLAQMTSNTTGPHQQEFANLTQQCAEESKQTQQTLKDQKQQLRAQAQITKAVKQEEKAVKQEEKAIRQEEKAVKQEQRVAKQLEKAVIKEQRAAKQLEKAVSQADKAEQKADKAALKVLNLEQKAAGARPLGTIDLFVDNTIASPNIEKHPRVRKYRLEFAAIRKHPWPRNNRLEWLNIPGLGIIDWSG